MLRGPISAGLARFLREDNRPGHERLMELGRRRLVLELFEEASQGRAVDDPIARLAVPPPLGDQSRRVACRDVGANARQQLWVPHVFAEHRVASG